MTRLTPSGSKHTDDKRWQAMGMFVVFGNYSQVARQLGLPIRTVIDWGKTEWWNKEIIKVRDEKSAELDMQLTNSINKARESIDGRLSTGDPYIKKDGEIGFKPVSCRDSATTFGILYDKLQLTRNMPTKIVVNQDLSKLQERFESMVNKRAEFEGTIVGEG